MFHFIISLLFLASDVITYFSMAMCIIVARISCMGSQDLDRCSPSGLTMCILSSYPVGIPMRIVTMLTPTPTPTASSTVRNTTTITHACLTTTARTQVTRVNLLHGVRIIYGCLQANCICMYMYLTSKLYMVNLTEKVLSKVLYQVYSLQQVLINQLAT